MFSSRDAFENDFCPVRDELLGEMYRANANGLPLLVESVSSEVRAMLALFCYRRSHLHALAIAIAASCTERELIQLGGRVGSTLYALSREPSARLNAGGNGMWPTPSVRRSAMDQAATTPFCQRTATVKPSCGPSRAVVRMTISPGRSDTTSASLAVAPWLPV